MARVELLSEERVRDGFLAVDRAIVRYELADGSLSPPVVREKVERGNSAAVLIHDPSRDLLYFVRQFRYPLLSHGEPFPMEIVAGKIDEGETPESAVRREAQEELGLHLGGLQKIAAFFPSPGTSSEMIHVYYGEPAHGSGEPVPHVGDGEDLEVVSMSTSEAFQAVEDGSLNDGKTLLALLWLRSRQ